MMIIYTQAYEHTVVVFTNSRYSQAGEWEHGLITVHVVSEPHDSQQDTVLGRSANCAITSMDAHVHVSRHVNR